jgi:hypothetical protein
MPPTAVGLADGPGLALSDTVLRAAALDALAGALEVVLAPFLARLAVGGLSSRGWSTDMPSSSDTASESSLAAAEGRPRFLPAAEAELRAADAEPRVAEADALDWRPFLADLVSGKRFLCWFLSQ